MEFYNRVQDEAGEDIGVRRTGLLFPAISETGREMLQQEYERELGFAPEVELLDADEACRLAPILARPAIHGGLYQPDAHQVDTRRVMIALAGRLESAGVDVRCGTAAESVGVAGGRVTSVRTAGGEIPTGVAINAAGAAAESLARRNGLRLGAVPLLESRFVTEPLPGVVDSLPMLLFFERDLMYARPQNGGLLIGAIEREIGAHGRVPLDAPPPRGSELPLDAMDRPRAPRALLRRPDPRAGRFPRRRPRQRPAGLDARTAATSSAPRPGSRATSWRPATTSAASRTARAWRACSPS